jgi:hypothetical protein
VKMKTSWSPNERERKKENIRLKKIEAIL